jgi:hypothetical protein
MVFLNFRSVIAAFFLLLQHDDAESEGYHFYMSFSKPISFTTFAASRNI